jgi:hypothetical protein
MKKLALWPAILALLTKAIAISRIHTAKSPLVSSDLRQGLDQPGLKSVSVSEDRDKGVATLGGTVRVDKEKSEVESIARSFAGQEVVASTYSARGSVASSGGADSQYWMGETP